MSKPYSHLKVLDLTTYVAAPCVGRLLADMGAEVIKIERKTGDSWRKGSIGFRPDEFSDDENPIYDYYNAGKKHIVLDMKTPEGMEIFNKLLAESDIFLTSTRHNALERLGIDYESLKEKYPRLIYAVVDGYGEKGIDADTKAFDITAFWARCGMMVDMAVIDPNTESFQPIYPPSSVGDTATAFLLFAEINSALYIREMTGRGQFCKAGLFHTGVFTFGTMQAVCQRPYGKIYPKKRHEHYGPMRGTYKCRDGQWMFFYSDAFEKFAEVSGHTELLEDERFKTPADRIKNGKELSNIITEIFLTKDRDEWDAIFRKMDITYSIANHFADLSEDSQAIANGFVEDVTYRSGKTLKVASTPIEMSLLKDEDMKTVPAPKVGEDTAEVLKSLGYSDKEIKELYDSGVTKPQY